MISVLVQEAVKVNKTNPESKDQDCESGREEELVEKSMLFAGKFEYNINGEDDDERVSKKK